MANEQQKPGVVTTDSFVPVKMSQLKAHGSCLMAETDKAYFLVVPKTASRATEKGNLMVGTGGWSWSNGVGIQANVMLKEQKQKPATVAPQATALFG